MSIYHIKSTAARRATLCLLLPFIVTFGVLWLGFVAAVKEMAEALSEVPSGIAECWAAR
ncbi:hypothetical protein [Phenylobacterium sp.]|uniref:hypothetical protein n=1 Tax=Phenylobacterium sp. TaxID=1871053 RepID=UPI0027378B2B|nr:hypothetical protein [Phenylobacterium sp.]MDP3869913.1 hypothetical protein [Phenylobacterium sp.]